ncbi:DUF5906 domain-containing protein [Mesorhizobium sp. M0757]|uniref:phage NrS-1 polymerase family protein n=1 Tax=Mesorhizobium sp. M0757 TaxID=2956993 RepID=UPI0033388A67
MIRRSNKSRQALQRCRPEKMRHMNAPIAPLAVSGNVPEPLKAYPQFVVWRLIQRPGEPKPAKLPFDPKTGQAASATEPATWSDYGTAARAASTGRFNGLGFVFTNEDPFAFIDLDNCRDQVTGDWFPYAITVAQSKFSGAAWETSQSGQGRHGILRVSNKAAFANKSRKWASGGDRFECYTQGRFVAFGYCDWSRLDLETDCGPALEEWVPDRQSGRPGVIEWEDAARSDYAGPTDDDELVRRASESKGGAATILGQAPSFAALWSGHPSELAKFFPDGSARRPFDNSGAELALANAFAWWTGCNPVRIERLMNRAPLCLREKWQMRGEYRVRTITSAIAGSDRKYFTAKDRREQRLQADMAIGDDLPAPPLPSVMTLDEMLRDLVHIGFGSQIVHRISRTIRSKEDAASEYAASFTDKNTGKIDQQGNPVTKRHRTLELWRSDANRTSVDQVTWQPDKPEICQALDANGSGQRAYNLWTPPRLMAAPTNWMEWANPFLQHVAYLVPIEAERTRFLQWLAHIVQRPGELPHSCYLMIATTTGIGRGTLASILTRSFRGYVAANADVGMLLNKTFNGRLSQKLLATVDEIREGDGAQRYRQQENFKSAVTEEERHVNPKFGRQYVEKNCCRWLLFSNHLDALPFDNNDRRVIVIENPTTPATPAWFEHLHKIINFPAFIASVQHYLATLNISDFKPGERAPMNAAKAKAVASMENVADKAARQFAATWPGDLATVGDLREFLGNDTPGNSGAMRHVIERAGMKTAHQVKIAGKLQTVLIVRGSLDGSDLTNTPNAAIVCSISTAQTTFRFTA